MQDDAYMIVADGWKEAAKLQLLVEDKDKKNKEKADIVVGKMKYKADLIPPALIVARYFGAEEAQIDEFEADAEAIARQMEETVEEHSGEEGLLEDDKDEKGMISKNAAISHLAELRGVPDSDDEMKILTEYLALIERGAEANKKVKDAQKALHSKVAVKYSSLSVDEIKTLVVDDKWLAQLAADVQRELDRVSQALTGRIRQLAERYATPLPHLTSEVATLATRVDEHLRKMSATWK
jgi:type I restriction enzyme M protein